MDYIRTYVICSDAQKTSQPGWSRPLALISGVFAVVNSVSHREVMAVAVAQMLRCVLQGGIIPLPAIRPLRLSSFPQRADL